jgi:hypothetical protein
MRVNLKEFFPPKRICEAYPYGAKWYQRAIWKTTETIKIGLNVIAWTGISGSVLYGTFMFGWYAKPEVIKAFDRVVKKEMPVLLVKICKAESGNRQFKENGKVLRGITTPSDIGYCQINETYWNDTARDMGIDIYTEEGNKEMAMYIFERQGGEPWSASRCSKVKITNCWRP